MNSYANDLKTVLKLILIRVLARIHTLTCCLPDSNKFHTVCSSNFIFFGLVLFSSAHP